MELRLNKEQMESALSIIGVKYIERGRSLWIICPYHQDTTESGSLICDDSDLHGFYQCFSCRKKTNFHTLIKNITGKSVYQILNIQSDYNNFEYKQQLYKYDNKIKKDIEKKIFNIEGDFYKITENTDAYNYLVNKRKINPSVIEDLNLTYVKYLKVNSETIENKEISSYLYNRIITPIYLNNELVNLDARDYTGNQKPKVLYPRKAMKPLFNFDNLNYNKPLYVDEGILNLYTIYSEIDKNVTAIMGNQLNDIQIEQINNFKEIIIIPNNDQGSKTLLNQLDNIFEGDIYIAQLPDKYNDVNDTVMNNDIQALYNAISNKKLYIESLINEYKLF